MRAHSTAAAVAVVAVALLITSVSLVVLLERSVHANAIGTATAHAQDTAAELVKDGRVTPALSLQRVPGESALVQVLYRGRVVAAGPGIRDEPPLTRLTPRAGKVATARLNSLPDGEGKDEYAVVALGVAGVSGADTVVVAQSVGLGEDAVAKVTTLLAIGCPILLLLVGVVTYVLSGRALRPVEEIRRRTAGISGADLSARVPVPTTGDEVARLAETMNEMLARLDASQHAQRRFVSDASHELRSPLAALRAEVEVAALNPTTTDWERTTRDVLAETVRMQYLVDDLLTLAKADERGILVHHEDVDLDDLAGAEAHRLREANGLVVRTDITPVRVNGDRQKLARVVRNLADNAALHAESRVAVRVRPGRDRTAILEVSDDGAGVPPDQRARVFDRFVRLDEGRDRAVGGSGLGLAIVAEIVAAHGGTVIVAGDTELGGARFRVTLPLG
ncbi:HAMP domain-containing sensor histidine kinase [Pengzhenrongella sp.]|uniref:sensor histidine kinase n=1 Tax=Pengzhenrongella sp. TaxID=2888820 RepID=UPI002F954E06